MSVLDHGNREQRRAAAAYLREQNKRWPDRLVPVSKDQWPAQPYGQASSPVLVLRSRTHLAQLFLAPAPAACRMSVCRTAIQGGRWADGISWDELQELKDQAGFGDCMAVEIYPPRGEVINVANMRHLWIYPVGQIVPFMWNSATKPSGG